MTECNAIIEANNEIDKLKRENKKLNTLCVEYGFEMGRLEEENEELKQTVSDWSGSYDELFEDVKRLEKENEQIKQVIKEAYNNERTHLGKSVLKQLKEAIQ